MRVSLSLSLNFRFEFVWKIVIKIWSLLRFQSMENLEETLVNDKIIDMVILDNIQMYSCISKHDSSIMNAKLFGFYLSISMEIYTKYS